MGCSAGRMQLDFHHGLLGGVTPIGFRYLGLPVARRVGEQRGGNRGTHGSILDGGVTFGDCLHRSASAECHFEGHRAGRIGNRRETTGDDCKTVIAKWRAFRASSRAVSCAGSTKVRTATNQEVAGSSPAWARQCFQPLSEPWERAQSFPSTQSTSHRLASLGGPSQDSSF